MGLSCPNNYTTFTCSAYLKVEKSFANWANVKNYVNKDSAVFDFLKTTTNRFWKANLNKTATDHSSVQRLTTIFASVQRKRNGILFLV